jgi:hypothetical protein
MDQAMVKALEAEKQQASEERTRLESEIKALNQQLEANRVNSDRQLNEAKLQAQADIQSLHEQMNQAMEQAVEAEKQQAIMEQTRLKSEIDTLKEQLKLINIEARKQQDKRIEQKGLLEQERNTSDELRDLVKTTEKALIEREKRFTDAKRTHQETLSELEQKIANLHSQLDHQRKSSDEIIRRHEEKSAQLQQSLSEIQDRAKLTDSTIRLMKKEKESQSGSKAQLEDQLAKLQIESQTKQAELIALVESERQEKESLRKQLEPVKVQDNDSSALQQAKEEIMQLKRKIKGMREVQLEMESRFMVDGADETRKLHEELRATQTKLKNAMKLANQSKDLLRENQIHESAINILSEDLDELTKEKKSLLEERDGLIKELSKIKELNSKQANEYCRAH